MEGTICAATPILALAGSYRRGSFNQALVSAAREEAPANVDFRDFDLRDVPFYDGDVEAAGLPPAVERLKAAVSEADALLLVTPEYNSGIPAVLKNGIDWASCVYPDAPISGKLVAIIGATPGRDGTAMAQQQLRQVVGRTGAVVIDAPEVLVARAGDVIDEGRVHLRDCGRTSAPSSRPSSRPSTSASTKARCPQSCRAAGRRSAEVRQGAQLRPT